MMPGLKEIGPKNLLIGVGWLLGLGLWISTITGSIAEYEFHAAWMFGLVTAVWVVFGVVLFRLLKR